MRSFLDGNTRVSHSLPSFLVYLPEEFWKNTVSCIQPFHSQFFTATNVTLLSREECSKVSAHLFTLPTVLNSSVLLTDCRLSRAMIGARANLLTLQAREVLKANETYEDLQRILYRLLLNPTPQLQSIIQSFRTTYFTKRYVFSIHIRMGGYLADVPERAEMMSPARLKRLPSIIQNAMISWDFNAGNTVLFLSTDSTFAERFIRRQLGKDFTIVTTNSFHRGHTKGTPNGVAVQRALVDLFLLSDSDALLIGLGSGFGRIAKFMGRSPRVIEYLVHHRIL